MQKLPYQHRNFPKIPVNNSGTDQRIPLRKLPLYNAAPRQSQCHSELKIEDTRTFTMPKAMSKSSDDTDEYVSSAVTNPAEVRDHVTDLEALMRNMKERSEAGDTMELLEQTLENMKTRLVATFTSLDTADINIIINAVKDKEFKVLSPHTEDTEAFLEELLPSSEIPPASDVVRAAREADTLLGSDEELIAELFDTLEAVHDQLATVSGLIGRLAHTLKPNQLMLVLKPGIRPLIQLRTTAGADIEATTSKPTELPEKQAERIEILITPDPNTPQFKKEKINSPTKLLVATYSFKIVNTFADGTTQRGLQERYQVKAKQLAACIMGWKYLGGTECKRKRTGSEEGATSAKKPSTSQ